jgi:hypothetical protein
MDQAYHLGEEVAEANICVCPAVRAALAQNPRFVFTRAGRNSSLPLLSSTPCKSSPLLLDAGSSCIRLVTPSGLKDSFFLRDGGSFSSWSDAVPTSQLANICSLAVAEFNCSSIAITIPLLSSEAAELRCRQRLYQLFFGSNQFGSKSLSVSIVVDACAASIGYSRDLGMSSFSGVVVDMGHLSTRAVAFSSGSILRASLRHSELLGGKALFPPHDLSNHLRWASCFRLRAHAERNGLSDLGQTLSIAQLIEDVILSCESGIRVQLARNIVLCGGMCNCDGLKTKLQFELKHLPWSRDPSRPNFELAHNAQVRL